MIKNPHFIIAGERRSGSTTLYDILNQHPEVGMLQKTDFDYFIEPELFSRIALKNDQKLKVWEQNHSKEEYKNLFLDLKGVVGQKDADLLWWKNAHQRVANYLPDTKFIIVLRNPVNRAESQYFNEVNKGRETGSFKEAITREQNANLSDWEKLHLQYLERGCYIKSLNHFYKYIPKERVKIVILEELADNWKIVMAEICEFLNIDQNTGSNIQLKHSNKEELLVRKSFAKKKILNKVFNFWDRSTEGFIVRVAKDKRKRDTLRKQLRGFYHVSDRTKQKMDVETKMFLIDFYKPFNKELEALIGRKILHW